jgi:hypothetical protein
MSYYNQQIMLNITISFALTECMLRGYTDYPLVNSGGSTIIYVILQIASCIWRLEYCIKNSNILRLINDGIHMLQLINDGIHMLIHAYGKMAKNEDEPSYGVTLIILNTYL